MKQQILITVVLAVSLFAVPRAIAEVSDGDQPTFDVETVDGEKLQLEALRGKVVLVDFWATWCKPCKRSFAFYRGLVEKYGDDGFVVVAVSVDEDADAVRAFLKKDPMPFTVVVDSRHRLAGEFEPPTMPTSYLVDRKGVVRLVHPGFRDQDRKKLEKDVVELLKEKSADDS